MRKSSARLRRSAAPSITARQRLTAAEALLDIRSIAEALIASLGEQATCHATYEALKARWRGDSGAMDQWLWIAGATREILRSEPVGEG